MGRVLNKCRHCRKSFIPSGTYKGYAIKRICPECSVLSRGI